MILGKMREIIFYLNLSHHLLRHHSAVHVTIHKKLRIIIQ